VSNATDTMRPSSRPSRTEANVGRPRKKPDDEPTPPRPPSRTLTIRVPAELNARLEQFLAAQRVAPTETSVVLAALSDWLEREGYPPAR
jgi:hypothetical protein